MSSDSPSNYVEMRGQLPDTYVGSGVVDLCKMLLLEHNWDWHSFLVLPPGGQLFDSFSMPIMKQAQ